MLQHPTFPGPTTGHPFLNALVGLCYAIQTATVILIAIQGFRHGSYGMPLWGVLSLLGICFICGFIGPALQPHLFLRLQGFPLLHWMWRGWTVVMFVLLGQYLQGVLSHPRLWPHFRKWILAATIPLLLIVTYGEWTFIVFYQDVYINETWPICILVMSVNYLTSLASRVKLKGLSVTVAWLWLVSNTLLYSAVAFGEIKLAYPCHDGTCELQCSQTSPELVCPLPEVCPHQPCSLQLATGYEFIYFVYALTISANLIYAIALTRRRHELRDDWDPRETLARMLPGPATLPS